MNVTPAAASSSSSTSERNDEIRAPQDRRIGDSVPMQRGWGSGIAPRAAGVTAPARAMNRQAPRAIPPSPVARHSRPATMSGRVRRRERRATPSSACVSSGITVAASTSRPERRRDATPARRRPHRTWWLPHRRLRGVRGPVRRRLGADDGGRLDDHGCLRALVRPARSSAHARARPRRARRSRRDPDQRTDDRDARRIACCPVTDAMAMADAACVRPRSGSRGADGSVSVGSAPAAANTPLRPRGAGRRRRPRPRSPYFASDANTGAMRSSARRRLASELA